MVLAADDPGAGTGMAPVLPVPCFDRIPGGAPGLGDQPGVARYEFAALEPMLHQLDGKVRSVPASTTVRIASTPSALPVIG